ncbi:MAG: hypothetical protein K9I36_06810 [Bacteroidia bacterium]|nr:hypothetical protein [Bacteroidia bacterium]MCF8426423.1 hypothetical protein [Bacteroidia bacterium]
MALCSGCKLFHPTAYFFISNCSEDKTPVDVQIKIGGQTIFDDSIKYTNVRPDLQYTPSITLTKGKYIIFVTAENGKTNLTKPIMLDGDSWIFIYYNFSSPTDSMERERLMKDFWFDTTYMNTKIRGTPPKVDIYIMDKEPIHM